MVQEFACLTNSQVMFILLVQGPHFEKPLPYARTLLDIKQINLTVHLKHVISLEYLSQKFDIGTQGLVSINLVM